MKDKINLLVCVDRPYLKYLKVILSTLVVNTWRQPNVFVLHSGLLAADEEDLKTTFPEAVFNFIVMDGSICKGFPTVKRYPEVIYYRIFAPLYLPEDVDRILYLDSDLVLHNSVDGFYETDFGDKLFVGCSHTLKLVSAFNKLRLGGRRGYVYMNTGVVLMNVAALKGELDVESICSYTVKSKGKLMLYDQDILYRFFGNRIKEADTFVYNLSDRQLRHRLLYGRGRVNADWVDKHNVVVHYIGPNKPWKKDYKGKLDCYYERGAQMLKDREERLKDEIS